jgi:hypothetical protein
MYESSTLGQEMLHGDLQRFDSDLGDMNTLTPKTKEDIEFQIGLIVKPNGGNFSKSRNGVE